MNSMTQMAKVPEGYEQYSRKVVKYRKDIFYFIEDVWGFTVQPVKPEYKERWEEVQRASFDNWEELKAEVKPHWFGDWDKKQEEWSWYIGDGTFVTGLEEFKKHKYITWQQALILLGVKKGYAGDATNRLTIRSGHGIGKSAVVSWIILWFLYCFFRSKAGCTAPTAAQLYDVLWNELNIWIRNMPEEMQNVFIHQKNHVRMMPDADSWFARARTGTKENPEALAGIHADDVLLVADEASGVAEAIFDTVEGALTSGNIFVILISNPTRTYGYFYDSHKKNAIDWQRFHFSSKNSPIVEKTFWVDMRSKHTEQGRENLIRVEGEFPDEGEMDDSGYIQLFSRSIIDTTPNIETIDWPHRSVLALDPSGKGKDKATWVLRDQIKAKKVREKITNNPRQMAADTITLARTFGVRPEDIVIEDFGEGSDTGRQIAILTEGRWDVFMVPTGSRPADLEDMESRFRRLEKEINSVTDKDLYLNIRALMYFRARDYLKQGGQIVKDKVLEDELVTIRYKTAERNDVIKLMPKHQMLKEGFRSPNAADAFALSTLINLEEDRQSESERKAIRAAEERVDDPYSVL